MKLIKNSLLSLGGTTIILTNKQEKELAEKWYKRNGCKVKQEKRLKHAIIVFPPKEK